MKEVVTAVAPKTKSLELTSKGAKGLPFGATKAKSDTSLLSSTSPKAGIGMPFAKKSANPTESPGMGAFRMPMKGETTSPGVALKTVPMDLTSKGSSVLSSGDAKAII